jgi:ribosome-associated heat shock protein Hsp15
VTTKASNSERCEISPATAVTDERLEQQRLDKWLWHARMTRTRTLAAKLVAAGFVRINGQRVSDPARLVRGGDVLTLALAHTTRVVKIVGFKLRRGSATVAQTLYIDVGHDVGRNGEKRS